MTTRNLSMTLLAAVLAILPQAGSAVEPVSERARRVEAVFGAAGSTETLQVILDETEGTGSGFNVIRVDRNGDGEIAADETTALQSRTRGAEEPNLWFGNVTAEGVPVGTTGLEGSLQATLYLMRASGQSAFQTLLYPTFRAKDAEGVEWVWNFSAQPVSRPEAAPVRFAFQSPFSLDVDATVVDQQIVVGAGVKDAAGTIMRGIVETAKDGRRIEHKPHLKITDPDAKVILDEALSYGWGGTCSRSVRVDTKGEYLIEFSLETGPYQAERLLKAEKKVQLK